MSRPDIREENKITPEQNQELTKILANGKSDSYDCKLLQTYYELLLHEFDREQTVKQSFESRTGFVFTVLGVFTIFLLGNIDFTDFINLIKSDNISFILFIKIFSIIFVLISIIYTFISLIKTISIRDYNIINHHILFSELEVLPYCEGLVMLIFNFTDCIEQHRKENEKKANSFYAALKGITFILASTILYLFIK